MLVEMVVVVVPRLFQDNNILMLLLQCDIMLCSISTSSIHSSFDRVTILTLMSTVGTIIVALRIRIPMKALFSDRFRNSNSSSVICTKASLQAVLEPIPRRVKCRLCKLDRIDAARNRKCRIGGGA